MRALLILCISLSFAQQAVAGNEYQEAQYMQVSLPFAIECHAKVQAISLACQFPYCNHGLLVVSEHAQLATMLASSTDEYDVRFWHACLDGIN